MLDDVGQRLLDDPVHGFPQIGWECARIGIHMQVHRHARGLYLRREGSKTRQARRRQQRDGSCLAEQSHHPAQFVQGPPGGGLHGLQPAGRTGCIQLIELTERCHGLQDDDAEPVAHLIVHLPGDAGALLRRRGLIPLGPLALQLSRQRTQLPRALLTTPERQPERPGRGQDPPERHRRAAELERRITKLVHRHRRHDQRSPDGELSRLGVTAK